MLQSRNSHSSSVFAAVITRGPAVPPVAPEVASPLMTKALDATGYAAVGLAAMLGGSTARTAGMSPVGALAVAGFCGMGGGTVRDSFLGRRVFWLNDTRWLWYSLTAGAVGYYGWDRIRRRFKVDDSHPGIDAVFTASLGGAALAGATTAVQNCGGDMASAAVFSLLSAAGGGIVRDVLLQRRPAALYPEGMASTLPAIAGSAAFLASKAAGASLNARIAVAVTSAVTINRIMVNPKKARNLFGLFKPDSK